jgi:hypothetical protein
MRAICRILTSIAVRGAHCYSDCRRPKMGLRQRNRRDAIAQCESGGDPGRILLGGA